MTDETTVLLLDVEGTTTALSFVHDVLFPYSSTHLAAFLGERGTRPEVASELERVRATGRAEGAPVGTLDDLVALLQRFIREDRKHPALKALQGMLWEQGYASAAFRGHVYDDVPPCLARWHARGITLAVYSSGSVAAQRLLFAHSTHGDLTPLFKAYFDTGVGPKREADAYRRIVAELHCVPERCAFLSDVEAELDAARDAGLRTVQLLRAGTVPSPRHAGAADFEAVGQLLQLP